MHPPSSDPTHRQDSGPKLLRLPHRRRNLASGRWVKGLRLRRGRGGGRGLGIHRPKREAATRAGQVSASPSCTTVP